MQLFYIRLRAPVTDWPVIHFIATGTRRSKPSFTAVEHWEKVFLGLFAAQENSTYCLRLPLPSFKETCSTAPRYLTNSVNSIFENLFSNNKVLFECLRREKSYLLSVTCWPTERPMYIESMVYFQKIFGEIPGIGEKCWCTLQTTQAVFTSFRSHACNNVAFSGFSRPRLSLQLHPRYSIRHNTWRHAC